MRIYDRFVAKTARGRLIDRRDWGTDYLHISP